MSFLTQSHLASYSRKQIVRSGHTTCVAGTIQRIHRRYRKW